MCGFVAHDLVALTVHWKAFIMVFDTLFLPLLFWNLLHERKKDRTITFWVLICNALEALYAMRYILLIFGLFRFTSYLRQILGHTLYTGYQNTYGQCSMFF